MVDKDGISQITFEELSDIVSRKKESPIILDVREIEEYVEGHIPGIPLLPMGDIVDVIHEFKRDEAYVFICRSGGRSNEVAKFFKANGIENVHNYAGGMLDWRGQVNTGKENIVKQVKDLY